MFIPLLGSLMLLLLTATHLIGLFYRLTAISVCELEEKFLEHTCLLSVLSHVSLNPRHSCSISQLLCSREVFKRRLRRIDCQSGGKYERSKKI